MNHFRLLWDRRGAAALEFAIIAPVFVLVYVVGADIVMMMRNRLRVEQAAVQGAQVISQLTTLYANDFTTTIYPVIQTIAGSGSNKALNDPTQVACAVTISGLDYPAAGMTRAGQLSIVWQQTYNNLNDGVCTANKVGAFNQTTNTPLIVVEVASEFKSTGLSAATFGAAQLQYSSTIAMPRQRTLPPITSGNRP